MSGKVVAITGASSGIGEVTARLLAQSGARLVLGARRTGKLAAVAREIEAAGGTAVAIELDVTLRESMRAFADAIHERFGRIDVLISNAGVMYLAPLANLRVDEWDRMFEVNVKGMLNGVAAFLPRMLEQGSGHFVTVGSIAGHQVMPMNGVYAATKFALRAIADSLRLEGGEAIRSTLISPGATATELFDKIPNLEVQELVKSYAGGALPADSIARAIAFAIAQPEGVDVNEILVRPMANKY